MIADKDVKLDIRERRDTCLALSLKTRRRRRVSVFGRVIDRTPLQLLSRRNSESWYLENGQKVKTQQACPIIRKIRPSGSFIRGTRGAINNFGGRVREAFHATKETPFSTKINSAATSTSEEGFRRKWELYFEIRISGGADARFSEVRRILQWKALRSVRSRSSGKRGSTSWRSSEMNCGNDIEELDVRTGKRIDERKKHERQLSPARSVLFGKARRS